MEITPGIFQVRVPVPFPLKSVNAYLVREADGWTMLDTGLNTAPALEAWDAAFKTLGIEARQLRRIVLTHAHPDHYGLAGHFQALSGAPVFALDKEISVVPLEWDTSGEYMAEYARFLLSHGVPAECARRIEQRTWDILAMLQPHPRLSPLRDGESLPIGGEAYRVIWTPGHADGHMVLHRERDGLLFGGDHVLMKITPNISLWPGLAPNPLCDFLHSLAAIKRLKVSLVLPGHRATFTDLAGRVTELEEHHRVRAQACWQAAGAGRSGYEIAMHVFPAIESVDDVRMAVAEVLGHLVYLEGKGRVESLEGKVIRYRQRQDGSPVD
ncbi:MAG: MBL fold metallo-hydrolase [Chloroflexi bacterium]|nr:MBL fold metallo-hydrolase [Chloroflexota bacterium]